MLTSAIVFTSLAVGIAALSAWWLYFSPLKSTDRSRRMSPTLAIAMASALGVSAALMVGGALWDASMHLLTGLVPGGRDFLWPPHLMIYTGFLLAFGVGAAGILLLVSSRQQAASRDPRRWVRAYPMIGAVVLASGYTLMAIPGDALWHQLVGPDLTAWSPPHMAIAAAMTAVVLCGVGLLLQARQERRPSAWLAFGLYALFGLTLNILYTVGVLEWELPNGLARMIAERPGWAYPVVAGCVGFFIFSLARFSTRHRMAATAAALSFLAFRFLVSAFLISSGNVAPVTPVWFLPAALVIDLVPWRRIAGRTARDAAMAAGFSLAFTLAATIDLIGPTGRTFFRFGDALLTILILWLACVGLTLLARRAGSFLGGEKGTPAATAVFPSAVMP
jgi:hypothetical protein